MTMRDLCPPPLVVLIVASAITATAVRESTVSPVFSSFQGGADIGAAFLEPPEVPMVSDEALSGIVERPIFREARSRRQPEAVPVAPSVEPVRAAAPPEPEAPSVPPELELVGVVKVAEDRRALVTIQGTDLQTWKSIGDTVDGWVISAITQNAITLRKADASHTVPLFR